MSETDGGKGSAQRPVDQDRFDTNWDAIFGTDDKEVVVETDVAPMKPLELVWSR